MSRELGDLILTAAELELREALRTLLLPVAPQGELSVVRAAQLRLSELGVEGPDQAAWVRFSVASWVNEDDLHDELRSLVERLLRMGDAQLGDALSGSYFELHRRLSVTPSLNHQLASALLSHARLVDELARSERMTAAQIARILGARDPRLRVGWREVQQILRALGTVPQMSQSDVQAILEEDVRLEEELFADADLAACVQLVSNVAVRLGVEAGVGGELLDLAPLTGPVHGPYLQMLHFLCLIAELYDHALSRAYEFSPRGRVPHWLFAQYPAGLNVSGNPFLNNAKSVDSLDRDWAASKDGEQRTPSLALVSVIEALDSLGFAARRELAGWIRRLLCRRIRLARGAGVSVPASLTSAQLERLLARAATGNTASRGIIEQRLVDALTVPMHERPTWIARGVGDPVNANNLTGRKFGDADFQNTTGRAVVAYELHGGTLSDLYVWEHHRSLEKVLGKRREEWDENVEPGARWRVEVVFVAHEFALGAGGIGRFEFVEAETEVAFQAVTFGGLIAEARDSIPPETLSASIECRLLAVMAEARTPDMARRRLLELLAP